LSNCILAFPNFVDSTYLATGYDGVAFSNGSWNASFPLSNLALDSLEVDYSKSTDATLTSTKGDVDLGVSRTLKLFCFYANNISRSGKLRIRATDTAKFSNMQVNALTAPTASALVFHNVGTTSQTITTGDCFTVTGDTTVYTAGTTATITAGSTASINISPNLVASAASAAPVICRTGDFTTPNLDTGFLDVWRVVYAFGSIPYGNPSFYDGKINGEDAVGQSFPFIYVATTPITGRYIRFEIDDTTNSAGFIKLGRFFASQGWQTTVNFLYGVTFGWQSNTQAEKTIGSSDVFERRPGERVAAFDFDNIPEDEAYANVYEMQRKLDISGQMVFVYDPEDTTNLHRRTILATMTKLQPIKHPTLDRTGTAYEIKEVIA
jgi:hypothetical protein